MKPSVSAWRRRRRDARPGPSTANPSDASADGTPTSASGAESWFAALGVHGESEWGDDERYADSFLGTPWDDPDRGSPDSRFISRQARRMAASAGGAVLRILRTYIAARVALAGALLASVWIAGSVTGRQAVPSVAICIAYFALTLLSWLLPAWRPERTVRLGRVQWLTTIGVDLLAFSSLHLFDAGATLNYVALLVLPVLMAGVLTTRPVAMATAAGVALMVLGAAWHHDRLQDFAASMSQAGLAGLGFFVVVVLAGEVAGRLAREELTARGSFELARQQARLNRLVMEQMTEGVLVVDSRGRVRTANPVALRLLAGQGAATPAPFTLHGDSAWAALSRAVDLAFDQREWPEVGRELPLIFAGGQTRVLLVRARFTRGAAGQDGSSEELCVLFLQDLRDVHERLRRDRLAAMGRVSAGVAHEIRNPLAAITQANALLQEDNLPAASQRLVGIVADNAARLKRIVDDVLEVAPGAASSMRSCDATAEVTQACSEWAQVAQVSLGTGSRLRVIVPREPSGVVFDPDHLRRVLVNLLDNAVRHASDRAGAIAVMLGTLDDAQSSADGAAPGEPGAVAACRLSVASDGEAIARDVENHLFEPFHSTRSRGSGLGLYICRQLCERYGGSITYERRPEGERHRNVFHVQMRHAHLPADERVHL